VVEAAAQLLATDGAGLMLADQARVLRWVTATGEAERAFERAQRDLGEGPCIDAFLLDQVVWTADLRVDPRWPRLGPAARDNQIRGVLSAPVSLAGRVLGTCNVITWTSRAWTEAETKSVGSFTTLIGRLLGATSEARHNGDLITQLQGALESRILIEQAKGVLMERDGISDLEAFDRLRRQARSQSRTINEVAREVIASRAP
jgi:GAF domain-containing protein